MTHSPKRRRIWAGALAALVALVAAVVVARPAAAAPAEAQAAAPINGYLVTVTGDEATTPSATVVDTSSSTITPDSTTPHLTISGNGNAPITINMNVSTLNSSNKVPVITLSNITTNLSSGVPITIKGLTADQSAVLVLDGTNTVSTKGNSAISVTGTGACPLIITGGGTLNATSEESSSATLAGGTNTQIISVAATATQLSASGANAAGYLATALNEFDNAPEVNLTNTGYGAISGDTALVLNVNEGGSLSAASGPSAAMAVNLGTGALTVDGDMSVECSTANDSATLGVACGTVTVGGANNAAGAIEDASLEVSATTSAIDCTTLTVHAGTVTASAAGGGTSNVAGAIDAAGMITVDGGTVTVSATGEEDTSATTKLYGPAINNTTGGIAISGEAVVTAESAGDNGVSLVGTTTGALALSGTASLTATGGGQSGDGINATAAAVMTVSDGATLVAKGPGYGIDNASGALTIQNNSTSKSVTGPVVTISSTNDEGTAVNGKTDGIVVIGDSTSNQDYLWTAQSGNGTPKGATAATPMLVRGYAGMDDDANEADGGYKFDTSSASNALPGTEIVIQPNPIASMALSVDPSTSGAARGMQPGFMVANRVAIGTSVNNNVFAYVPVLNPTFTVEGTPDLAPGLGVDIANSSGAFPGITAGGKAIPAGNSAASGTPIVYVGTSGKDVAIAATGDANQQSYELGFAAAKPSLRNLVNSSNTILGALYPRQGTPSLSGSSVPMSYEVLFYNNGGSSLTAEPTTGDSAGVFFYNNNSSYAFYLTKPGVGTPMNGIDPSLETATPVAQMPSLSAATGTFVGWYERQGESPDYTYGPAATTQLDNVSQNTSYYAAFGQLATTAPAFTNSPLTIEAGTTGTLTLPMTISAVDQAGATVKFAADKIGIAINAAQVSLSNVVNTTASSIITSNGGNGASGPANGVTFGTIALASSGFGYVLNVPVVASEKATQGSYNVTVELNGVTGAGSGVDGVVVVEGVAPAAGTKVYRLYNPGTGEHLLTTSENEMNVLVEDYDWRYEGVAWNAAASGVPVYRLYNPNSDDHYFTTSKAEIASLLPLGWKEDNGGQPVFYGAENSNWPVYQLFNPNVTRGTHLWTIDKNEYDVLSTREGWQGENAKWFAQSPAE